MGTGIVLVLTEADGLSHVRIDGTANDRLIVAAGASVRHAALQEHLRRQGYVLPSDPTSGPISYIGGNVATRASGPHALRYGSIDSYVRSIEATTMDGEQIDTAKPTSIPPSIRRGIDALGLEIRSNPELAALITRKSSLKSASGYILDTFLHRHTVEKQIAKLMCGQVGTLAIVTSVTLEARPLLHGEASALLGFDSSEEALAAVPFLLESSPAAVEFMNRAALRIVRDKGRFPAAGRRSVEIAAAFGGVLLVEFLGAHADERLTSVTEAARDGAIPGVVGIRVARSAAERDAVWAVRKGLMPAVQNYGETQRALPVVNDVAVPVERLVEFVHAVETVFEPRNLPVPIYGHAGNGNLHLRPIFDLTHDLLRNQLQETADEIYELVVQMGGTVTGEHGIGRLRAPYMRKEWGDEAYAVMKRIKKLFDPQDLLNPGTMFNDEPLPAKLNLGP